MTGAPTYYRTCRVSTNADYRYILADISWGLSPGDEVIMAIRTEGGETYIAPSRVGKLRRMRIPVPASDVAGGDVVTIGVTLAGSIPEDLVWRQKE